MSDADVFTFPDLNEKQKIVFELFKRAQPGSYSLLGYGGSLGGGKDVDILSYVQTPHGTKLMAEIAVGDLVSSPEGGSSTVLGVYPQGEKDLYRVTFNDGSWVDAGLDHQWMVRRESWHTGLPVGVPWGRPDIGQWRVRTTKDIIAAMQVPSPQMAEGRIETRFYIPETVFFSGKRRNIESIEFHHRAPSQCITVSHPQGLWLTNENIVTHNTALLALLAARCSIDFPGDRILIGRNFHKDLEGSTRDEFFKWMPKQLIVKSNAAQDWVKIALPNWPDGLSSHVQFGGLEDYMNYTSTQWGKIFVEEAHEVKNEQAAKILLSRLRHPLPPTVERMLNAKGFGQKFLFCAASNPYPGWFERWFYRKQMGDALDALGSKANVHFVKASLNDNRANLPEAYEAFQTAQLGPTEARRLIEGRFDEMSGMVYPTFSPNIHQWLGRLPEKDEYRRVVGGLDFGGEKATSHFSAGIIGLVTRTNRLLRVAEFRDKGPGVDERMMAWMLAMEARWAHPLGKRIAWKGDQSQGWILRQWKRMGFNVIASNREEVGVGVKRVQRLLDVDEAGYPGSYYTRECPLFEEEMLDYAWPDDKGGGIDTAAMRKPISRKDDILAADRYMHELLDDLLGADPMDLKNRLPVVA